MVREANSIVKLTCFFSPAVPAGRPITIRKQKQFRSAMKDLLTTFSLALFYASSITFAAGWNALGSPVPAATQPEGATQVSETVADDVGERGPPATAPDAPELPALVRPTVEDGGAEVRPARRRLRHPGGGGGGGVAAGSTTYSPVCPGSVTGPGEGGRPVRRNPVDVDRRTALEPRREG